MIYLHRYIFHWFLDASALKEKKQERRKPSKYLFFPVIRVGFVAHLTCRPPGFPAGPAWRRSWSSWRRVLGWLSVCSSALCLGFRSASVHYILLTVQTGWWRCSTVPPPTPPPLFKELFHFLKPEGEKRDGETIPLPPFVSRSSTVHFSLSLPCLFSPFLLSYSSLPPLAAPHSVFISVFLFPSLLYFLCLFCLCRLPHRGHSKAKND